MPSKPSRDFYAQDTLTVAQSLIGMYLLHRVDHQVRIGRIVETEAYQGPEDLAAHSARGLTPRNAIMFGAPGHAYVYLIYGMWHCVNVVTRIAGIPHAVLIRGIEPVTAIAATTHGPGLLCRAMGIDRTRNGADLLGDELWIEAPAATSQARIASARRIGVGYAQEWAELPWRFYDADSAHVSTLSSAQRHRMLAPKPGHDSTHKTADFVAQSPADTCKKPSTKQRQP
jgi:DNA-3-methyladenine glycosylase